MSDIASSVERRLLELPQSKILGTQMQYFDFHAEAARRGGHFRIELMFYKCEISDALLMP